MVTFTGGGIRIECVRLWWGLPAIDNARFARMINLRVASREMSTHAIRARGRFWLVAEEPKLNQLRTGGRFAHGAQT